MGKASRRKKEKHDPAVSLKAGRCIHCDGDNNTEGLWCATCTNKGHLKRRNPPLHWNRDSRVRYPPVEDILNDLNERLPDD